jgi:hypothetical protein
MASHRPFAEDERRHCDEGIGGVEVSAQQKPGDDGPKSPSAETPFMQHIEIGLPPARGDEAEPSDE